MTIRAFLSVVAVALLGRGLIDMNIVFNLQRDALVSIDFALISFAGAESCIVETDTGGGKSFYCINNVPMTTDLFGNCSCACEGMYYGTGCAIRPCLIGSDCNSPGTVSVEGTVNTYNYFSSCECGCSALYDGSTCSHRICVLADECNATNTLASEYRSGACRCDCREQFAGPRCDTRICHHKHDCGGRGIGIQSGVYPACICQCQLGFGGRQCRTLSATYTSTIARTATSSVSSTVSAFSASGSASVVTALFRGSLSSSRSTTPSTTASVSLSSSRQTNSVSDTFPISMSSSKTAPSPSNSASPKDLSSSASLLNSTTSSLSRSLSLSPSFSHTATTTDSQSETQTCKALDDLPFDTCAALRPLEIPFWNAWGAASAAEGDRMFNTSSFSSPSSMWAPHVVDAEWIIGGRSLAVVKSDEQSSNVPQNNSLNAAAVPEACTRLLVPRAKWSGRPGSTHAITVVAVDGRVSLKANLPNPPTWDTTGGDGDGSAEAKTSGEFSSVATHLHVGELTFVFPTADALRNATQLGIVLPEGHDANQSSAGGFNATGSYFIGTARIRYDGPTTMNKKSYALSVQDWTRCPIPFKGELFVTLQAVERLMPDSVRDATAALGTTVSFGSSLSISPTAIVTLGVISQLSQLTRCAPIDLDDPHDDDSYADFKSGSLANPLGLAVGGGGEGRSLLRGALISNFVFGLALALLSLVLSFVGAFISRLRQKQRNGVTKKGTSEDHDKLSSSILNRPWSYGFPSTMVASFAFILDGAVGAGALLGLAGSGAGDAAAGWGTIVVLFACVGFVGYVCTVAFPRKAIVATPVAPVKRHRRRKTTTTDEAFSAVSENLIDVDSVDIVDEDLSHPHRSSHTVPETGDNTNNNRSLSLESQANITDNRSDALNIGNSIELASSHGSQRGDTRLSIATPAVGGDDFAAALLQQTSDCGSGDYEVRRRGHTSRTHTHNILQRFKGAFLDTHEWKIIGEDNSNNNTPPNSKSSGDDDKQNDSSQRGQTTRAVGDEGNYTSVPTAPSNDDTAAEPSSNSHSSSSATAERWLAYNSAFIADVSLSWYCPFELFVATAVCLFGTINLVTPPPQTSIEEGGGVMVRRQEVDPDALRGLCLARGSVITLLLLSHFVVLCALRPIVVPWRCNIVRILVLLQTVAGCLAVANVILQRQEIELAMDIVAVVATIFATLMTTLDFVVIAKDSWPTISFMLDRMRQSFVSFSVSFRSQFFVRRGTLPTENPQQHHNGVWVDDMDLAIVDEPHDFAAGEAVGDAVEMEDMSVDVASEEDESSIVAQILSEFNQHETIHGRG